MNINRPAGCSALILLTLFGLAGCSDEGNLGEASSAMTAPTRDLRDAPRCEPSIVDEYLQGRWILETVLTTPGSGPGCDLTESTLVDTTDLCVGDSILFVGGGDYECTMVGDWGDFVLRVRLVTQIVPGCEFETVLMYKGGFVGDAFYASLATSQTVNGSECGPYESIQCVGRVLTITGRRIGPPQCSAPRSTVFLKHLREVLARTVRNQTASTANRTRRNIRQITPADVDQTVVCQVVDAKRAAVVKIGAKYVFRHRSTNNVQEAHSKQAGVIVQSGLLHVRRPFALPRSRRLVVDVHS